MTAEFGARRSWVVGHVIASPLPGDVLIVTFPEKLKKLVSTMLTGTLVWPMLKFTIEGSDILKSPTETVAEAECNVPPGNPVPVIVTE